MKNVFKKSSLIILTVTAAVCAVFAACFAFANSGHNGAVAHAVSDNADMIYWWYGNKLEGMYYSDDMLILSNDEANLPTGSDYIVIDKGALSADTTFEKATDVPWYYRNVHGNDPVSFPYSLEIIGTVAPLSTAYWFTCNMCNTLDLSGLDTSSVTNMSHMFENCWGLTSLDLSSFDTTNVTNMSHMFENCWDLTSLDLSGFDTTSVTDMNNMFVGCFGLTSVDLSSINTASVADMSHMFKSCFGLTSLDLSGFDTTNVTNINSMFADCYGLTSLDLSGFDTTSVTDMNSLFAGCSGLTSLDLSGFDTTSVTDMNSMFNGCSGLTSVDLSSFDTSSVTNISNMFTGCSSLTSLDLSGFDTSSVINAGGMLDGLDALESLTLSNEFATTMGELDVGLNVTLYVDCGEFYEPADGLYSGLAGGEFFTNASHELSLVEAVAATCSEEGNVKHYLCSVCEKAFEDAEGTTEIADVTVAIDPDNHDWVHKDGKEPTATENGYTEYEECSLCGVTRNKTDIPATGGGSGEGGNEGGGGSSSGSTSTGSGGKKKSMSNTTLIILLSVGVGLVTLMAVFALILAIKKRKEDVGGGKDEDGFYDDYIGAY